MGCSKLYTQGQMSHVKYSRLKYKILMKKIQQRVYLFIKSGIRSEKSIALTVYRRRSTSTDSIHFPVCIIIVHYMEISMPAPVYYLENPKY